MIKLLFLCLILFVLIFGCSQSEQGVVENKSDESVSILIQNFAFSPSQLTIEVGTTVTWINNDSVMHTVTGGELDSPSLYSGEKYSHTFNTKGIIDYICTPHPYMRGRIIVE